MACVTGTLILSLNFSRLLFSLIPQGFRSTKNISVDNFLVDLDCVAWNTLEMFNDPNEALEQWYCLFNNVLDIHVPFMTCRFKIQHQPDWFSASISSAIKQRNNLQRQAVWYNNELHWREYRLAHNQVVHLIRKKRDFYRNIINCNFDNLKTYGKYFATWLLLNVPIFQAIRWLME